MRLDRMGPRAGRLFTPRGGAATAVTAAAAAAIVLLVVACDSPSAPPSARSRAEARANRTFDGIDIYRGLAFGDGPVANVIPSVRDYGRLTNKVTDSVRLAAVRRMENRLVAQINKDDPSFFGSYERALRSGNPLTVDRALKRSASVTLEAARNMPEIRQLREKMKSDPEFREQLFSALQTVRQQRQLQQKTGPALRPSAAAQKSLIAAAVATPPATKKAASPAARASTVAADVTETTATDEEMDAVLASFLDGGTIPQDAMFSAFLGIFIYAFVVFWLEFAVVQDYGAVLNVAVAINYYAWIFGDRWVYSSGGGGGGGSCDYETALMPCAGGDLMYEQLVQDASLELAPAY